MKIQLPSQIKNRPRPAIPTVALTDEAYDALAALSSEYNVSMRTLASAIITSAHENIEIEKVGGRE